MAYRELLYCYILLYHELTNSRCRALHPASQDIRSLMSPEKQMSAPQPLVFP